MSVRTLLLLLVVLVTGCSSAPVPEPEADRLFRLGDYRRAGALYEAQAAQEADPERAARHLFRAALSSLLSPRPAARQKGLSLLARLRRELPESSYAPIALSILDLTAELESARADTAEGHRLLWHLVEDAVELRDALEESEASRAAEKLRLEERIAALEAELEVRDQALASKAELVRRLRRELEELKRIDMEEAHSRPEGADDMGERTGNRGNFP